MAIHPDPDSATVPTRILSLGESKFTIDCPAIGDEGQWSFTPDLGEWKSWVVLRNGDYLALVDRSTQTTAWCAPMGLGGSDEAPVVLNDSPVGRPAYVPGLDPDTMGAAWPNGKLPILAVVDGRLRVLQQIAVQRPEIHSQQSQFYDAYLGIDDTGVATWLKALPLRGGSAETRTEVHRDFSTGAVLFTQSGYADGDGRRVLPLNAATGAFRTAWGPVGLAAFSSGWIAFSHGNALFATETETAGGTAYGLSLRREEAGAVIATSGPWPDYRNVGTGSMRYLVEQPSASDGSASNKIASYALSDGKGRTITAPFPIDFDNCVTNGFTVWVCTGRTSDSTAAIAAFDEVSGKVLWHWKTGDPESSTGVPREVPNDLRAWGDYVYGTNSDGVRYVLDAATGKDAGLETHVGDVTNGFGELSVTGNTITWEQPLP